MAYSLVHMKTLKRWKYDNISYGARVMLMVLMHDIIENLCFRSSTRNREASVFQNLHSRTFLENLHFGRPKTPLTHGRNVKTQKKTSVFKNTPLLDSV